MNIIIISILFLVLSIFIIAMCFNISDSITSEKTTKYDDFKIFDVLRWCILVTFLFIMTILGMLEYLKIFKLSKYIKTVLPFIILIILCIVTCFVISGIINNSKLSDFEKVSQLNSIVFYCSTISCIIISFIISQVYIPLIILTIFIFGIILFYGFSSNLSVDVSKCQINFIRQSLYCSILSGLIIGFSLSFLFPYKVFHNKQKFNF